MILFITVNCTWLSTIYYLNIVTNKLCDQEQSFFGRSEDTPDWYMFRFLCFNGIPTSVGYLMLKSALQKNSNDII